MKFEETGRDHDAGGGIRQFLQEVLARDVAKSEIARKRVEAAQEQAAVARDRYNLKLFAEGSSNESMGYLSLKRQQLLVEERIELRKKQLESRRLAMLLAEADNESGA